jgi:hypothetical protein
VFSQPSSLPTVGVASAQAKDAPSIRASDLSPICKGHDDG